MAQVWVVGQVKEGTWELGGVFTTPERAAAACSKGDGYWPVELDKFLGRETWVMDEIAVWPHG